jgi:hypothetical protein
MKNSAAQGKKDCFGLPLRNPQGLTRNGFIVLFCRRDAYALS